MEKTYKDKLDKRHRMTVGPPPPCRHCGEYHLYGQNGCIQDIRVNARPYRFDGTQEPIDGDR